MQTPTTPNTLVTPLLSHAEACKFLHVANQTLRNWRCTGEPHIPFVRIGTRRVMYRLEDLMAFVEQSRVA